MSFIDTYPTPDQAIATARDVAGWHAAHALWLLGRADRRRELHGPADFTYMNLLSLVATTTDAAYVLHRLSDMGEEYDPMVPDEVARELLEAAEAGDDYAACARRVASWGGYDPDTARDDGYES